MYRVRLHQVALHKYKFATVILLLLVILQASVLFFHTFPHTLPAFQYYYGSHEINLNLMLFGSVGVQVDNDVSKEIETVEKVHTQATFGVHSAIFLQALPNVPTIVRNGNNGIETAEKSEINKDTPSIQITVDTQTATTNDSNASSHIIVVEDLSSVAQKTGMYMSYSMILSLCKFLLESMPMSTNNSIKVTSMAGDNSTQCMFRKEFFLSS
jgi:hypothetical protein